MVAIPNFKVELSVTENPLAAETLYRIYDLEDGTCQSITRADIMNNPDIYGGYETDYTKIGSDFTTPLSDVFIWTGVTNYPGVKTTKLVMRKLKAKDIAWRCGDAEETWVAGRAAKLSQYWVAFPRDYYVGVFEITQAQYEKIYGSNPSTFASESDSAERPVETAHRYLVHSNPNPGGSKGRITGETVVWPNNTYRRDVGIDTFMDKLRIKTGVEFDLPTAAEWQYACRAGSERALYSGKFTTNQNENEANVMELGWASKNSDAHTRVVGTKPPNAYGLYDMLGNVAEMVHNYGNMYENGTSGTGASADDPIVDPAGSNDGDAMYAGTVNQWSMGGSYDDSTGWINDIRSCCWQSWNKWSAANKSYIGFRVVCPDGAQWSTH